MPVSTTWSILDMTHMDADGGVINAKWQCVAQNDSGPERAVWGGESNFTYDPSAPDFTPYADLTETQVIGWVKDQLGAEEVAAIQTDRVAKVDAQIQMNNEESTGLPWETA